MASRYHFVFSNARSVTLKQLNTMLVNQYDEINYGDSNWTDSTIKILINPNQNDKERDGMEGIPAEQGDVWATVDNDSSIAIGNLIVDGSITYRVMELKKVQYKGINAIRVYLRWERAYE